MSNLTDHYSVLEVTPDATEEIDVAYRRLIRAWHPDNYPVDAPREIHELAEERTKLLIEARQELRDPERRRAFDERRSAGVNENGHPARETEAAPPPPDQVVSGGSSAAATPPAGGADAAAEPGAPNRSGVSGNGRLVAWFVLAGLLAAAGFAIVRANIQATGDDAYQYAPSISAIVFSALMLGLVLWIAPGIRVRDVLALRPVLAGPRALLGLHRPRAWRWALGAAGAIVVGSYAFILLFDAVFGPFEGDDRIPTFWDGSRAPQFALSFLVVAVLVPIEEELIYRGLGYGLLERFGTPTAIIGTALMFGLAHGSFALLPIFVFFGLAFGWLRSRTGSIYPGMLAHGVFNGAVTILAVTFG